MTELPPLVLLHGITNSARIWAAVTPLLADHYDLLVPTAAGHRGGPRKPRNLSVAHLVDDVERLLDARGIERAHVAGNSLGGWMALELAHRDRALSVCAFSPAGCWTPGTRDETRATNIIRDGRRSARGGSAVAPLALRSRRLRRSMLRAGAEHADRLSPRQAVEIVRDLVECDAADDLLGTNESLSPMLGVGCPITLAWSQYDRVFPPRVNGVTARQLFPQARFIELPGVGNIPMIDDTALCAETIRAATGI